MRPSPFQDPREHPTLAALEEAYPEIREELERLGASAFSLSPDSLGERPGGYDERGWMWYALCGEDVPLAHRLSCPATVAACERVQGLVNAGFSRLLPGTHLEPHHGELEGVLRCHLGLEVPRGDVGIRFGTEVRGWREGACLAFNDTHEHDAWNSGEGPRTVLLVTFRP